MAKLKLSLIAALTLPVLFLMTPHVAAQADKPNIILILTDDQTTESYEYMPFLESVRKKGATFKQYYHTLALCCPSRTSILTGMYPHNHGVLTNNGRDGGYRKFAATRLELRTWGKLLSDNGYKTALLGKFLNGYSRTTYIPKGWSRWFASYDVKAVAFNYEINDNGTVAYYGEGDENYFTNVISDEAHALIIKQVRDKRPLAILFSPHCPHGPSTPAHAYEGTYAGEPFIPVDKPSFNEEDVSDKPEYIRNLPLMSQDRLNATARNWRKRLECARSIDDAFQRMWNDLAATGQLSNTYFFLTTDNGFMKGEHRVPAGKVVPYQESINSTLFVWGPGVRPGHDNKHLVANIDFMPTFAQLAGVPVPDWVDGRSIVPLLVGDKGISWRNALLVRGVAGVDGEGSNTGIAGDFLTYVTEKFVFTRYLETPEKEYYDMIKDPYQLENIFGILHPNLVREIETRLDSLASCAKESCRIHDRAQSPER